MWNGVRRPEDIFAWYETNAVDPAMVLMLRFNSHDKEKRVPSGVDDSSSGNHFTVGEVTASQDDRVRSFGVSGDGTCYCSQFGLSRDFELDASACNRQCEDGDSRSCGSSVTTQVVSAYTRGELHVGGLAPATAYAFTASFVTMNGDEYDISQALVASTTTATVPGRVDDLRIVENSGNYLEFQWSAVEDNGGAEIVHYQLFVNGYLELETANGYTHSAAMENIELLANYTITICALNGVGAGPQSALLTSTPIDTGIPSAPEFFVPRSVSGGTVTLTFQDSSTSSSSPVATLVIEQRESYQQSFATSAIRVNGTSVTVYKLRHDTVYIFRAYFVSSIGSKSAFSTTAVTTTGKTDAPDKTPLPVVTQVSGKWQSAWCE